MSGIFFGMIVLLLLGWPSLRPAEAACEQLPAASLAEQECEHVQLALKALANRSVLQDVLLGIPPGDVLTFRCPDETAAEIQELAGTVGAEVRGSYHNLGTKPVHEVIIGFALFTAKHEWVDTVEAAVLPRTIPPGGSGTFATVVPSQAARSWSCFRYEITGLVN